MTARTWAVLCAALITLSGCLLAGQDGEVKTGAKAAEQLAEQVSFVEDPALQAYVDKIGARLVDASPRSDLAYQFRILDMPEPNAFALPGGFIYVSRGLLVLLGSEDELAGVVGHELGHVAARHHVKQTLRNVPLAPFRIATGVGGALASIVSPLIGQTITGTGELTSALLQAPYSRDQEREADRLGQEFAAASGWDPGALSQVMTSLGREEELAGGDPNRASFLATHPASAERSRAAKAHANQVSRTARPPVAPTRDAFLDKLVGLLVGQSATQGVFDGDDFLHPDLGIALTFPSGWEQANSDHYVGASDEEKGVGVLLQLAGEGDDPMTVAREASRRARLESGPEAARISGLPAARARVRSSGTTADVSWIAYQGHVYQLTGFAPTKDFQQIQPLLRKTADSFRVLSSSERKRIREDRIEIVQAREGETLAVLLERTGSRWSADHAAVANATLPDEQLTAGSSIKITRPAALAN